MQSTEKTLWQILVKELPAMRVASLRILSSTPERDAIKHMKDLMLKNKLNYNDMRKFGVDIPVPEAQYKMGLRGYELWACLPKDINKLQGTTIKRIPKANYAVLRIMDPFARPFDKISNGWLELDDWVKTSGYKTALHNPNNYMMEELLNIDGETFIDLYYPICFYDNPN
jgi:hypothetical protein